jgi:hypothetical protein
VCREIATTPTVAAGTWLPGWIAGEGGGEARRNGQHILEEVGLALRGELDAFLIEDAVQVVLERHLLSTTGLRLCKRGRILRAQGSKRGRTRRRG